MRKRWQKWKEKLIRKLGGIPPDEYWRLKQIVNIAHGNLEIVKVDCAIPWNVMDGLTDDYILYKLKARLADELANELLYKQQNMITISRKTEGSNLIVSATLRVFRPET